MKNHDFNSHYSKFVYKSLMEGIALAAQEALSQQTKQNEINTKTTTLKQEVDKTVETKKNYLQDRDSKENQLVEYWRNDKKAEKKRELEKMIPDPKALAVYELEGDIKVMQETRLLLMLIEKYLPGRDLTGRDLSYKLYQDARAKGKEKGKLIDLDVLRERFIGWPNTAERSKNELQSQGKYGSSAIKELGFYYLPEPRKTYVDVNWGFDKQGVMPAGWYTWDNDKNSHDEWHGKFLSQNLHSVTESAPTLTKRDLSNGLYKGLPSEYNDGAGILEEIKAADSGLEAKRKEALGKDIIDLDKENQQFITRGVGIKKQKEDLFKNLTKLAQGKFIVPNAALISQLNVLFGPNSVNYQYRYIPEQNRVYCLSFNKGMYKDAYIEVDKDSKLIGKWVEYDSNGSLSKDLFKDMSVEKFSKEYLDAKIQNTSLDSVDKDDQLNQTRGMLSQLNIYKTFKKVEYNDLDKHLSLVKNELMLKLKDKVGDVKANTLAQLRIDDFKAKINVKIEADAKLKLAIKETPTLQLKLNVKSNDDVEVGFGESKQLEKFTKKAEALRQKGEETAESFADKKYLDVSDKIASKFPGFMGVAVKWILDNVIDLKKGIGKLAKGESAPMTSMALSMFGIGGIGALKAGFRSKEVDQKAFDELLNPKAKELVLKKKLVFKNNVRLDGKKIIIPKGKGVLPGAQFSVDVQGVGRVDAMQSKQEDKGGKKFWEMKKKAEYQFKDNEIIIQPGTEIPKDTVIPSGAKIVRV
ncbi:hypothetical protein KKD70_05145 [Patescibacteria group bacterium]|nr:hypothetical protein [Patescibacteria group bacterium]